MARLCTNKYEKPQKSNLKNAFMHLTNYSLNKKNENYKFDGNNEEFKTTGSKRTFSATM